MEPRRLRTRQARQRATQRPGAEREPDLGELGGRLNGGSEYRRAGRRRLVHGSFGGRAGRRWELNPHRVAGRGCALVTAAMRTRARQRTENFRGGLVAHLTDMIAHRQARRRSERSAATAGRLLAGPRETEKSAQCGKSEPDCAQRLYDSRSRSDKPGIGNRWSPCAASLRRFRRRLKRQPQFDVLDSIQAPPVRRWHHQNHRRTWAEPAGFSN